MINKKKKGFSIAEVIISIATLAFVSGFILQMFIVSEKVNKKALDLDIATNVATTSIELFLKENAFEDYIALDFFENSVVEKKENEVMVNKFYDKNWKTVKTTKEELNDNKLPKDVVFALSVNIYKSIDNVAYVKETDNNEKNYVEPKILFTIDSKITNNTEEQLNKAKIVEYKASKYSKRMGIISNPNLNN